MNAKSVRLPNTPRPGSQRLISNAQQSGAPVNKPYKPRTGRAER